MVRPPATPEHFEEAVRWFRERIPMTDQEYDDLVADARRRAFTIANVGQLDLVAQAFEAVDVAISAGATFEEFRQAIGEQLANAWGGDEPWHLETIYRTNIQQAYSDGRWEQLADPDVVETHPYWKFLDVQDSRETQICESLHGTVLRADDPFWRTHSPPLHFNCRSTIVALTDEQAKDAGVDESPPSHVQADDGFGSAPPLRSEFQPNLVDYPDELADVYRRHAEKAPK